MAKSGRSRTVSLDAATVEVLRDHRKRQAGERSSLMTVLVNAHNDPPGGEKPDAPPSHARLHDLRHVHVTTLLLAGVPVHVVAARLGHANPSTRCAFKPT